jgi:hypothetical protein
MEQAEKLLNTSLENRKVLQNYIDKLQLSDLFTIPDGFNNNIIWQIGHMICVQQQLVYGLSGLPLTVSTSFANKYGRGSFPKPKVQEEDLKEITSLLFTTVVRINEDLKKDVFKTFKTYKTLPGIVLSNVYEALEFNNFHDEIHLHRIKKIKEVLTS